MVEQGKDETLIQAELVEIADALEEAEEALARGPSGDSDGGSRFRPLLRRMADGWAACERVIEDHATGARRLSEEDLHCVAIVLNRLNSVAAKLSAEDVTPQAFSSNTSTAETAEVEKLNARIARLEQTVESLSARPDERLVEARREAERRPPRSSLHAWTRARLDAADQLFARWFESRRALNAAGFVIAAAALFEVID